MKKRNLFKRLSVFVAVSAAAVSMTVTSSAAGCGNTNFSNKNINSILSGFFSNSCNTNSATNYNDIWNYIFGNRQSSGCTTPSTPDCTNNSCTDKTCDGDDCKPVCDNGNCDDKTCDGDDCKPVCDNGNCDDKTCDGDDCKPVCDNGDCDDKTCDGDDCKTPVTPENPVVSDNIDKQATDVFTIVNREREAAGLSTLTWASELEAAANLRAKEIVQSFSHTRPNGKSFYTAYEGSYRSIGENIAMGQRSPEAVMTAWMNSAGHRANILSENYTGMAVGYYEVNGYKYWVQLFIR